LTLSCPRPLRSAMSYERGLSRKNFSLEPAAISF
jgi:hypothetical protein